MRIVIVTTLNNNLFRAKLTPLIRSRPDLEIVVVSDRQGPELEGVRWIWPRGPIRFFGRLLGRIPLIAREILHPRTKIVMAYSVVPHGLFAYPFAALRRLPLFLHFIAGAAEIRFAHDLTVTDNRVIARSKWPAFWERVTAWVSRRAALIFVPGSNTKSFLEKQGYDTQKIQILHSTADPSRFYPGKQERDIEVIVVAQLRQRKRPAFTLRVLQQVQHMRPGTRFCWLGDGMMRSEFEADLKSFDLCKHIIWQVTDEVDQYYRRARIFLLCSINEGLSLSCLEAMACGVVPVTTDCGDMADAVRSGDTGELIPLSAPVSAFADAVVALLDDAQTWRQFSVRAQNLIQTRHGFSSAERSWARILHSYE